MEQVFCLCLPLHNTNIFSTLHPIQTTDLKWQAIRTHTTSPTLKQRQEHLKILQEARSDTQLLLHFHPLTMNDRKLTSIMYVTEPLKVIWRVPSFVGVGRLHLLHYLTKSNKLSSSFIPVSPTPQLTLWIFFVK